MNKVIETIKTRVSCRSYSNKKVSLAKANEVALAGSMAPSAMNRQIINILLVRSKKNVNKLKKLSNEARGKDCFYGATTMLIVYGPKDDNFTKLDGACALENMFIAANALKLNSCWINQVEEFFNTPNGKKVRKSFGLTENDYVVGTCILGYKNDDAKLEIKPRKEDFIKVI